MQTGGGGRELKDFHRYCELRNGQTVDWLVWVYDIDCASDHILTSVSKGPPPGFLAKESDFEDNNNSSNSEVDVNQPFTTPRKRKSDQIQEELNSDRLRLHKFMDTVEKKVNRTSVNPIHSQLAVMSDIRTSLSDAAADESLTPNTKQELPAVLASEKNQIAKEIIVFSKKKSENNESK